MTRLIWVIVIVAAVLGIATAGILGVQRASQSAYAREVTPICTSVSNVNSQFAVYAAKTDDFSALKDKCEKASFDLANQVTELDKLGAKGVPTKYATFHKNLQGLISSYQSFYAKTAAEAASWNKTDFQSVETLRQAVLKDSSTCVSSWPAVLAPVKNETTWCVTLAGDLKKLADGKKTPAPSTMPVFVVGGAPVAGGTVIMLPSINGQISYNPNAGYMAEMRSLLGGYKRLRGDLNRATEIYDNGGGIAYDTLNSAIASRTNILKALRGISAPAEYAGAHNLAIETLQTGVDAVTAFRDSPITGGRQLLTEFSATNNGRMEQLKAAYGF